MKRLLTAIAAALLVAGIVYGDPVIPALHQVAHDGTCSGKGTIASPLSCGGGLSGLTTGAMPVATSSTTLGNSNVTDSAGVVSTTDRVSIVSSPTTADSSLEVDNAATTQVPVAFSVDHHPAVDMSVNDHEMYGAVIYSEPTRGTGTHTVTNVALQVEAGYNAGSGGPGGLDTAGVFYSDGNNSALRIGDQQFGAGLVETGTPTYDYMTTGQSSPVFNFNNGTSDSTLTIENSDATGKANVSIEGTLTVGGNRAFDRVGTGLARDGTNADQIDLSLAGASCTAGNGVTAISATGTGTCSPDVTSVVSGTGISTSTTAGAATITANLGGGTCTAGNVASALSSTGTLTCTAIGTQGGVTGTGTSGTLTKWTGTTAVGNAGVLDNGTTVSTSEAVSFSGGETLTGGLLTDTTNVGVISPAAISTTQDDWTPTGLNTAEIIQVNTSGQSTLNGIAAPTGFVGGRKLCLRNVGANTITVANEALTSSANNRFANAGSVDFYLYGGNRGMVCFFYDVSAHRWTENQKLSFPNITVGQSSAFTVDVLGNVAGRSLTTPGNVSSLIAADQKIVNVDTTGATVTTAGGAVTNYGVSSVVNSTRSLGASNLTNVAGRFSATAGQVNWALRTEAGDNHFNVTSGSSEFHGNVIVDGTCTGCGGAGLSGVTTNRILKATGTTSAGNSSSSDDGTTTTMGDAFAFGVLSPASISGVTNDWTPTSIGTAVIVRISTTALTDLTGLSTCTVDGRVVILRNVSSNTVRLWDEDARSTTAADRLHLRRDILSLPPDETIAFTCSTSDSRWHVAAMSFSPTENAYKGTHIECSDDWLGTMGAANLSGSTTLMGMCGWMPNAGGTGAFVGGVGAAGRPGMARMATGTTATGHNGLMLGNQTFDFAAMSPWMASTIGMESSVSNSTDGFAILDGFFNSISAVDQAEGCYFLYDERQVASAPLTGSRPAAGSNNFSIICATGSVRTQYPLDGTTTDDTGANVGTLTLGVVAYPNTNVLRLWVVMSGTSKAQFFADTGSGRTLMGTITTHIPTGGASHLAGGGIHIIKNVGTTNRQLDNDQVTLAVDLNAARSP